MKKFVYPEDSLKHIECSIVAFNGNFPIKHFDDDRSYLMAWRARALRNKKIITVEAYDKLIKDNPNQFETLIAKLRSNVSQNRAGDMKAYAYFTRNYGLTREQIDEKLGIK